MINDKPLISVCITSFNYSKYIEQTVRSIINQTYQNLEIIICDNASIDDTDKILKELASIDSRIIYIRNQTNIGSLNNTLKAMNLAKGDFITLFHADDVYDNTIITKQLSVFSEDPSIGAVFTKSKYFHDNNINKSKPMPLPFLEPFLNKKSNYYVGGLNDFFPLILKYNSFFACPSYMTRRDAFKKVSFSNPKYGQATDVDHWLNYLKSGYKLGIVNEYLLNYRLHNNQDSSFYSNINRTAISPFYNVIDDFLAQNNIEVDKDALDIYNGYKALDYLKISYAYYRQGNKQKAQENVELSKNTIKKSILSLVGIFQRFPRLYYFYKWLRLKIRI